MGDTLVFYCWQTLNHKFTHIVGRRPSHHTSYRGSTTQHAQLEPQILLAFSPSTESRRGSYSDVLFRSIELPFSGEVVFTVTFCVRMHSKRW